MGKQELVSNLKNICAAIDLLSIAGVSAGALSGSVASPFYMLKTQQQSLSSIQVGNQHSESNTGMFRFFKSQVEKGGITGKVLHSIK